MSPRKSGHWASLQQAMAPVQTPEENIEAQPVQEKVEESVAPVETVVTNSTGSFMDDDFDIPANAFSLFDDEEKASEVVADSQNAADSQNTTEELLIGETEEPPAKASECKWTAVSVKNDEPASSLLDDDFEIPANAFSLYDDEEETKPAPKRPVKEKKSDKPASEKSAKKDKSVTKAELGTPDKADKARKPRKEKKDKVSDSLNVEEVTPTVAPEHVCEEFATGELDETVIHFAEVQTPVFYPVHQTEVAPVVLPEQSVATESTPTQWSATALLDDLIPDSEIDRVNQKTVKTNFSDKKTSKKLAKAESKSELKPAKASKKPIVEEDDDIPFDIPANAFSLPDYKVKLDKKSESKSAVDKKREKFAKAEPIQEVSKRRVSLPEEDDFDIPSDAFSMFDEEEEKPSKPIAKSRPAKPIREPKPVREEREERFEKEVRESRSTRRREPIYEDDSDEYPVREQRRPERVAKPVRRPVEEMEEEETQPVRKTRDVREREVRDGEVRRPAINIPSWRDVMDVLIDMNLNRRRETERPSRTARGPRNSDAFKPENYDDYEEKFERQERNNGPRRRSRRPE